MLTEFQFDYFTYNETISWIKLNFEILSIFKLYRLGWETDKSFFQMANNRERGLTQERVKIKILSEFGQGF